MYASNPEIGSAVGNRYKLVHPPVGHHHHRKYWVNSLFGRSRPLLCLSTGLFGQTWMKPNWIIFVSSFNINLISYKLKTVGIQFAVCYLFQRNVIFLCLSTMCSIQLIQLNHLYFDWSYIHTGSSGRANGFVRLWCCCWRASPDKWMWQHRIFLIWIYEADNLCWRTCARCRQLRGDQQGAKM